ncbi:DEKNAAC100881 [Brettanomyces naardenensis]|uniref:DEKNAAC100881 n=1 Tax=Brettanomyces naardenensis TaxID=13370 RepID=A0A448YG59_BRENA|nr:DEKNAAC100881 [Brettanomyces naardenensis]
MFLQFLTPKFDPSLEQEYENESIEEGTSRMDENDEEFRPFIRRLPEFRFWFKATSATAISLACSLFPLFDIPVFWPILVVYFVVLFALTMRRQIQHMIKYKYIPFDIGKTRYSKKSST